MLDAIRRCRSVGVFGGTFDPIHTGHLILAERAWEELGLDAILFMPAFVPPHKTSGRKIASGADRIAMVAEAIEGIDHFALTDLEIRRKGVSYTVDSLEQIRAECPDQRIVLLMGSDNARDFTSWMRADRIVELAEIAVWERPGSYYWPEVFPDHMARKISSPLLEISSTELRGRVCAGRSIRFMTPDRVIAYIEKHGLYR